MDNKLSPKRLAILVLRAQAGDREAVDRLLEIHQGELFGYLLKMLRDRVDAEDALQTSMMQVVKKLKWLRDPSLFRPWLFRIASRKAFEVIKRRQRTKEFSNAQWIDTAEPSGVSELEQSEWIEEIPQWLDSLTPKGREVLILHYLQGFKAEEVAEILGIPLGTAKSRISYSLACIRKQVRSKNLEAVSKTQRKEK